MAGASASHSTDSAKNQNSNLVQSGTDSTTIYHPSHVQPTSFPVPRADLPLRQLLKPQLDIKPKYHDITDKFTRACNELKAGQLVKDDQFTLFESIGATEVMDPKMDSGFLHPGESPEDEYDPLVPILPEELVGIMDQLLCHEMAWHTGYPLSQTLLTSVYIDRLMWPEPKTLEQSQFHRSNIVDNKRPEPLLQMLRAYCLALIKGCDLVIAKITGSDYYEEEDFCTNTYNRVLFPSTSIDSFLSELDSARETLQNTTLEMNGAICSAIISRLTFRGDFLRALDLNLPHDQMIHSWPILIEQVDKLRVTHELGRKVSGAFSIQMQRRLASTVPPRPIVELGFLDALAKFQQLCLDCQEATRFIQLDRNPLEYQSFIWYFASRSPSPLTYSRAYLANLLFNPEILENSTSLPLMDLTALCFTASPVLDPVNWTLSPPRNKLLPKPPQLQLAILIDDFIGRSGQPYLDLWVALGQNRCRLCRMLTHAITSWNTLQADASVIDAELYRVLQSLGLVDQSLESPLSTWAYHKKLWMIEKVLLLSFEQDIYLPDEFADMYLYLFLTASRRIALLERVDAHLLRRRERLLTGRNFREAQEVDDAWPYVASLLSEARGVAHLSLALARFYIVLLYLNLLPKPNRPLSGEALRYELRMKPFLDLQPSEAPPFEEFKALTQPFGQYSSPNPSFYTNLNNPCSELWSEIEQALKAAKKAFMDLRSLGAEAALAGGVQQPWRKDVQSALASATALGVAVAGVKNAVIMDAGYAVQDLDIKVEVPEPGAGKRYAESWVVVKIVKA